MVCVPQFCFGVSPRFGNVRSDWSIHVSFVLFCFDIFWQFFTLFTVLVDSRVICVMQFFCVFLSFDTIHDDWFIHVSSVVNSFFGTKTWDSRTLHLSPFVSWIVFAFVGL